MPRAFFRVIGIVGNGTDANPYRPRYLDNAAITGWAACYKADTQDRVIALVQAPVVALQTLAAQTGVTYLCSLADLRNDVGTSRQVIRTAIRAYSGMSLAEWHETMVGEYRTGD